MRTCDVLAPACLLLVVCATAGHARAQDPAAAGTPALEILSPAADA